MYRNEKEKHSHCEEPTRCSWNAESEILTAYTWPICGIKSEYIVERWNVCARVINGNGTYTHAQQSEMIKFTRK